MQYMTQSEAAHAGDVKLISRLYNKLHTRHEYLLRIEEHYEHDL